MATEDTTRIGVHLSTEQTPDEAEHAAPGTLIFHVRGADVMRCAPDGTLTILGEVIAKNPDTYAALVKAIGR